MNRSNGIVYSDITYSYGWLFTSTVVALAKFRWRD